MIGKGILNYKILNKFRDYNNIIFEYHNFVVRILLIFFKSK